MSGPTRESQARLAGVLQVLFAFRVVMLAGSFGAFIGSLLMIWQGGLHLVEAFQSLSSSGSHSGPGITVPILEAVDSFLFGVVLIIFAYGIAVGFVIRLPEDMKERLPAWMKIDGVGQLKAILAEVVVVVLVVIFARVVVQAENHFEWVMLVLPIAIVLIAGAIRLLELGDEAHAASSEPTNHSSKDHAR
ncbi:MAG: YqhA family protein [Bauldia sp.]